MRFRISEGPEEIRDFFYLSVEHNRLYYGPLRTAKVKNVNAA